jgi:hypothetical protein
VMNLVLMTQYFDMLKEIGASSRTNAILIPHSPGSLTSLTEQVRNAMMEADLTVEAADPHSVPLEEPARGSNGPSPKSGRLHVLAPPVPGDIRRAHDEALVEGPHRE